LFLYENYFYLLIAGSRDFTDYNLLEQLTDQALQNRTEQICIVSGGARGTDTLARQYAYEKQYDYLEFKADWNTFGKSAGYIRNEEMHKFISQFENRGALYFWDGESRGTAQNFDLDLKYNIKNFIIKYKEL
jgi:hypothetical protein